MGGQDVQRQGEARQAEPGINNCVNTYLLERLILLLRSFQLYLQLLLLTLKRLVQCSGTMSSGEAKYEHEGRREEEEGKKE
jgi:hypothetical protein